MPSRIFAHIHRIGFHSCFFRVCFTVFAYFQQIRNAKLMRSVARPQIGAILRQEWQTPARREARNHRSEDAEMLGPLPRGPQRTGRADQREARGDANRDRSTQNHRRRVLLSATQRPRSTNNETTTTTRHPELRDPRSDSTEDKLRGVACSFIERH